MARAGRLELRGLCEVGQGCKAARQREEEKELVHAGFEVAIVLIATRARIHWARSLFDC
jgi:hypothetical protein